MPSMVALTAHARHAFARIRRNREAQVVALFSGVTLLGSLAANRLLTEVVPPDVLGEYYLIMNVALWLSLPAASGYVYVSRHWAIARSEGATRRFVTLILKAFGLHVGLIAGGTAAITVIAPERFEWRLALLIFVTATAQALHQSLDPIQNAERRRLVAGLLGLLASPIRPFILAIGIALATHKTAFTLTTLHAAATVLLAGATSAALAMLVRHQASRDAETPATQSQLSFRAFLRYAGPYFLGVVAMQVCTTAERWGLAHRSGGAATAMFVQAAALGTVAASSCGNVIMAYYQPIVAQAAGANPHPIMSAWSVLRRYVTLAGLVLAALVVVVAPLAPWATRILFGPRFSAVEGLLPWAIAAGALFAFGQVLTGFAVCAREVLSPNVAYIASRILYVGLLMFAGSGDLSRSFTISLVISNAVYVILVAASAIWLTARERFGASRSVAPTPR